MGLDRQISNIFPTFQIHSQNVSTLGGKQEWHQDYGYWYNNGLMTPQALSVFVPLDKCTEANGCLQIITGTLSQGLQSLVAQGQLPLVKCLMTLSLLFNCGGPSIMTL